MKSVRVGSWTYKIEYRELSEDEAELLETDSSTVAGICLRAGKQIVIVPEYKDMPSVLLHEIGHAIDYEYPIYAIEDQEARADMYASMLVQLFLDNPELFCYMRRLRCEKDLSKSSTQD